MSNCTTQIARVTATRRRREAAFDWQQNLPKQWRRLVIAPLLIERFRDYEMAAERLIGRDEDEQPCYYSSRFVVTDMRSDDDEEFYQGERPAGKRLSRPRISPRAKRYWVSIVLSYAIKW